MNTIEVPIETPRCHCCKEGATPTVREVQRMIYALQNGLTACGALWSEGFQMKTMGKLRALFNDEIKRHRKLLNHLRNEARA